MLERYDIVILKISIFLLYHYITKYIFLLFFGKRDEA